MTHLGHIAKHFEGLSQPLASGCSEGAFNISDWIHTNFLKKSNDSCSYQCIVTRLLFSCIHIVLGVSAERVCLKAGIGRVVLVC